MIYDMFFFNHPYGHPTDSAPGDSLWSPGFLGSAQTGAAFFVTPCFGDGALGGWSHGV